MAREPELLARDEWFTAGTFSLFVLTGCGYIIAAKLDDYSALSVTMLPVGVMLLYAVLVKALRSLRLRDDQAGDNLYYMGFLFTLTSLGVSLYQFTADGAAEEIVQNFGIAIGSTIAGVALRVVFNQMRRDPVEVEHSARLELAEAARKVRRELDRTVIELGHFRRSSQQAIEEGFEEVRKGMQQVSGRILGNFEEMTAQAKKPFESASESSSTVLAALAKTIAQSLEAAAKRLADENEKLAGATTQIVGAFQATADKLGAMQTPDKVIEIKVEPMIASLTQAIAEFGSLVRKKSEEDSEFLTELQVARAQSNSDSQAVRELANAIAASSKAIERIVERMEGHEQRFEPLADAVRMSTESGMQDRAALQEVAGRLDRLLGLLRPRRPAPPPEAQDALNLKGALD